ncbi:bifunctional tetrahydrofolate synthase/dihydrofolate synthase [Litchfieldella xinjiangensis]|uniref:bifunctional tetrahydrofolate synthase/dihydrofolate synthase n=1 Tax=Litchfieldella xinjiangensis TaxID=1166948 RepID=UPI0005BD63BE|nr:bifunctional tetrahydrofolate synthase/dihydrofolate synthase [Halomonas xinjiangensis]
MTRALDVPSLTLDAWLERLERQHPVAIDLGLERVARVGQRLGLQSRPLARHVISVAGTNGKGSTVAMLDALTRAHGLSCATYTSPHLLRYNERLCIDGVEADDALLIEGFERVEAARLQGEPVSLTYFEAGSLAAFWAIAQKQPDVAVLEVGLGGRLDAVNIIDADVAIVTTVAQDHAAFLGTDIDAIGREKAGIMRSDRPAVLGSRSLPASVRGVADRLGAPVFALGDDYRREVAEQGWTWHGKRAGASRLCLVSLPDPGLPLDNAATALQALTLISLRLDEDCCRQALAHVKLPGRMQWLDNWCLDVAHNPHAAEYVASRLAEGGKRGRRFGLLGMLVDKDAQGVVAALSPVIDAWVVVTLEGDRARSAEQLAEVLVDQGRPVAHRAGSPQAGAEWLAANMQEKDEVLVCGSFYTVAEVLAWCERRR